MDPRRSLHGLVPEPYLGGHATTPRVCAGAGGVAKEVEARMPDDDAGGLEPGGPRIVVLVDDYDLLTTAGQQQLAPFVPFVPSGRDIGLHFVVARRVAGRRAGCTTRSSRRSGRSAPASSSCRATGRRGSCSPRVRRAAAAGPGAVGPAGRAGAADPDGAAGRPRLTGYSRWWFSPGQVSSGQAGTCSEASGSMPGTICSHQTTLPWRCGGCPSGGRAG